MIKGWRYLFYAVVGIAVGSIAYITISFILTDRLVKATGDEDLAVRQAAAHRVMRRHKPIDFLATQPQTVRDNVIWALEGELEKSGGSGNIEALAQIACDLSGELPVGEADRDTGRLTFERLAAQTKYAAACVQALRKRVAETTQATLEKEKFAHRRAVAARLLGLVGATSAEADLVKALRDEYELVRQQGACALARLKPAAGSEGKKALDDYLSPLLHVLGGEYQCYVRLDSEGRVRNNASRDSFIYGPFLVRVKTQSEATPADLARQRDSASFIQEQERARTKESEANLAAGRQGHVVRPKKGQTGLGIVPGGVTLQRQDLVVKDPANQPAIDVVEGEMLGVRIDLINKGPGDLVSDFFVAVCAGSPLPRNNVDRPAEGPYKGERARDLRALIVPFEKRHNRAMYHANLADTPYDDTVDTTDLTLHFDAVETDRIEALKRLVNIGDASAVPALGRAMADRSYTVRRQAVKGLQRILEARHTDQAARQQIAKVLRATGLSSKDAVVRCAAAEGLRFANDAQSGKALLDLLVAEKDPTVRLVATRSMVGLPEGVRRALLPQLVAGDPTVRMVVPRLLQGKADSAMAASLLAQNDAQLSREVLRSASQILSNAALEGAMASADARTRALAAQLLGERRSMSSRAVLMAALRDVDGDVRAAAAEGLGLLIKGAKTPDAKIVAALVGVVKNEAGDYVGVKAGGKPADPATAVITDKNTRARAVEALVGLKEPEALLAVRDALQDTNADVLAAALPALRVSQLGDQRTRLNAIMADAKMPARVRQAAALSVWHTGMNIHPAAGTMPPADPLAAAAKALARTEAKKADAAKAEPKKDVKEVTEQDLVDKTLDAMVGLLNDANESVKTAAAVSLIGLGDDRGNKVLRDQLRSKNLEVRREAARLLATLPAERIAKLRGLKKEERDPVGLLFKDLYSDGSLKVNFRFLCRALASLGDNGPGVERLRKSMADADPVLRAAALTVLTDVGDKDAVSYVLKGLDDSNELVRSYAAQATAKLGMKDAATVAKLSAMVGDTPDPSETVQASAQQALLILGARS
ncbi:MAG: HEAT repeat domain-containing protein [Armatimonadetes bacterium]|nr:HEAT repeat domain-containing protein [Armatimonadota bacterium]